MSPSDITIVIPTFRRPDYLLRTIKYYGDCQYKGTLLVGDSSDVSTRNRIQEFLDLNRLPNIGYYNCERIDATDTLALLMGKIKTKYIAFCGDDDYLVPTSIERCMAFLDDNPDYSCACGRMVTYTLSGYNTGTDTHQGVVTNFWEYYIPSIEHSTAAERLAYYSLHNPLVTYSIFRTNHRAESYRYENVAKKDASLLTELVPNFYSLITGKLKSFNHLHAFRQKGSQHRTSSHYTDGVPPEIIDWILTPKFIESYKYYEHLATPQLSRIDEIDEQSAKSIIKKQFQASCGSHCLFPMFNVYSEPTPWTTDHEELRQCYRSVQGESNRTVFPEGSKNNGTKIPLTATGKRPHILLVTQRWNGGVPEGGTTESSKGLVDSLASCEQLDSTVLYTDQIWHDYTKSADEYLVEIMQASQPDVVAISSLVQVNSLRSSTLSFLKHSGIPVVTIWETDCGKPLSGLNQHSTHNVVTVTTDVPNQAKLWPPIDFHAFHDPGFERKFEIYCLGDVMSNQPALAVIRRLIDGGFELRGIRDWRFEYFIRSGRSLEEARTFRSSLFDPYFYQSTYLPELPQGMDALTHYLQFGWKLNYKPNPLFDTTYYRSRYPECEAEGTNPLIHFINTPAYRGCNPHPYFDGLYYQAQYPDVAATGINPLEHYLQTGVAEGRQASAPMSKHEYAHQLKSSRIALNFNNDRTGECDALRRSFEAIMCGSLLLEPEQSPLSEWFTHMIDYVPYKDGEDLIAKVSYYLANEEERSAIARKGYQKAATDYTGKTFWQKLCETVLPIATDTMEATSHVKG